MATYATNTHTHTTPQFTSVLHILAERAEWKQLVHYLHTLRTSTTTNNSELQRLLLTTEGPHGWTPLMLSCARAPACVIQLLLQCCPESARVADRSGTFPLHFVSSWGEQQEAKAASLPPPSTPTERNLNSPRGDRNGNETGDDDNENGNTSGNNKENNSGGNGHEGDDDGDDDEDNTHASILRSVHSGEYELKRVLKLLLENGPEILAVQNQWGQTPLHCVFDNEDREISPSIETIKVLLGLDTQEQMNQAKAITKQEPKQRKSNDEESSSSSSSTTKSSSSSTSTITKEEENIVRKYALQALSTPDTNSYLPLHLAASRGASEDILNLLISQYPMAAMTATTSGDLPVHLLQYHSEDEVSMWATDLMMRQGSWRGGSGIFRLKKSHTFNIINLRQVECLLRPLCKGIGEHEPVKSKRKHRRKKRTAASANDQGAQGQAQKQQQQPLQQSTIKDIKVDEDSNEGVPVLQSDDDNDVDNSDHDETTASGDLEYRAALNLATRLPGSRGVNLPIHIAAEHGASFEILHSLCETNVEGVATSQPISKSMMVSSSSSLDTCEARYKSPEIFPIEVFEKGRAGLEALKASHLLQCHLPTKIVCSSNTLTQALHKTQIEGATEMMNIEILKAVIRSFEERSDLLFAYYPEAMPAQFRETKRNRNAPKPRIMYRKDQKRMYRLERLIRSEALDTSSDEFSVTARRVWLWMYRGINSRNNAISAEFQGAVGRIITGLPREALLKLSFISHIANDMGIDLGNDVENLRGVPCMVQGKSIIQYAAVRDASMTMDAMLFLNDNEKSNAIYKICECLSAHDALAFSSVCRQTIRSGVRLFPENKLKESGRSWLLPPRDQLAWPSQAEFWQHLDSVLMIPNSTHTIFVTYYLEVSESSLTSYHSEDKNESISVPQHMNGGLIVVGENAESGQKIEGQIVGKFQKKLAHSAITSVSGYEVQVSFNYQPHLSYSLRVYGPKGGGRVSISNARVRQVIHCLDGEKRSPLQVLLMKKQEYSYSPLVDQISTLLDDKYRFAGIDSTHLLHFALENKVSTEVLEALVDSNPSLLLETDGKGRTPLHTLFLLCRGESPSLGTVKMLLRTPGENATKLKDKDYKVPLHIAAEQGVSNSVLELLVEAYPDGCYRQTKNGDIPIHLLVRSGKACKASVEMLLRPIMDSETICSMAGSRGVELPLHIAAEYNCCYNIIERLLLAYVAAATIPRRRPGSSGDMYALDIFESNRRNVLGGPLSPAKSRRSSIESVNSTSIRTLGEDSLARIVEEAAHLDMHEADFNLRSDLIFVHFPVTPKPYRKESDRIKRLCNMIRREAFECVEMRELDGESKMSNMAQLAWCFLCTFESPDDPEDHYADEVGNILSSLTIPVVKLLASVSNPFSTPPHMILSECASPRCRNLISSRVLFVGRYVFDESQLVLHQSDDSFVVAGRDYGAVEAYKRLLTTFKQEELPDIDDLASVDSGSIVHVLSFTEDTASYFVNFAIKIGLDEDFARQEFDNLVSSHSKSNDEISESTSEGKKELTMEMFREFCDAHNVDSNGVRRVAVKFMKHRRQFLREKVTRARLGLSKSDWYVFPVIEDYDIDRADGTDSESTDEISPSNSWELSDSKDKFFAVDIQEMNSLGYDFSSFKYALVLPRGDKDLNDMAIHGEVGIKEIRDLLLKVGKAVKALHCRQVIHGNLILSNIVQFGTHVALIDLDSATLSTKNNTSMLSDKIAGISQRFATGAMPPELIAQIDLVGSPDALYNYEQYWKHVHKDASEMDLLNSDDVYAISNTTKSLYDQVQAFKSNQDASNVFRMSIQGSNADNPEVGWKEKISVALEGIGFEDLPPSLCACENLAEFRDTWSRLKSNSLLWERIRPRYGEDMKYAYVIKYHDDTKASRHNDYQLPYDLVPSSHKIDVWAFGVILFSLCTRSSLFHQTLDGNLHGTETYARLYNWTEADAKNIVRKSVKNPLAQDLLLKILVKEEDRLPSIDDVLMHPFFGPSSSSEAQKIIQESLDTESIFPNAINSRLEQAEVPSNLQHFNTFSMEKFCRIIFDRLGDIKIPTGVIVLPYKLRWNNRRQMLEPPDKASVDAAEQIGQHLLDINTTTAKFSFWLRVKENLAEKNGAEFKSKIINWIHRAKKEDTRLIAKEIVSAINASEAYEGICIEMLEEEMSISHARAFIRDPMKAAMLLIEESKIGLAKHLSQAQFLYLIDEFRGCPSLPIAYSNLTSTVSDQSFYPVELPIDEKHVENTLFPFINIAVMIATANDGLNGLAHLLGLREIPESWNASSLGLVHAQGTSGRSTIVEFATLQGILRKQKKKAFQTDELHSSSISQDYLSNVDELGQLELFFQQYDQLGDYADLHQAYEEDKSLVFWTRDEDESAPLHSTPEFIATIGRLERLQSEIIQKKRLEEEVIRLNMRLTELKKEAEEKRRKRNSKKVRLATTPKAEIDSRTQSNDASAILSSSSKATDEHSEKSRVLMM